MTDMIPPIPPVGTPMVAQHGCWVCTLTYENGGPAATIVRGTVEDHSPGGAASAFLMRLDEPWFCPGCGNMDELIATNVYRTRIVSAIDLLGELL